MRVGVDPDVGEELLEATVAYVARLQIARLDRDPQRPVDRHVPVEVEVRVRESDGRHRVRVRQTLGLVRVQEGVIEVEQQMPVAHGQPRSPRGPLSTTT